MIIKSRTQGTYFDPNGSALSRFAASDYEIRPLMKKKKGKLKTKKTKQIAAPPADRQHRIAPPGEQRAPYTDPYFPDQRATPRAPYETRARAERALDDGLRYQPKKIAKGATFNQNDTQGMILKEMGLTSRAELEIARDTAKFRAQKGTAQKHLRAIEDGENTDVERMVIDLLANPFGVSK